MEYYETPLPIFPSIKISHNTHTHDFTVFPLMNGGRDDGGENISIIFEKWKLGSSSRWFFIEFKHNFHTKNVKKIDISTHIIDLVNIFNQLFIFWKGKAQKIFTTNTNKKLNFFFKLKYFPQSTSFRRFWLTGSSALSCWVEMKNSKKLGTDGRSSSGFGKFYYFFFTLRLTCAIHTTTSKNVLNVV